MVAVPDFAPQANISREVDTGACGWKELSRNHAAPGNHRHHDFALETAFPERRPGGSARPAQRRQTPRTQSESAGADHQTRGGAAKQTGKHALVLPRTGERARGKQVYRAAPDRAKQAGPPRTGKW